MQVMFHKQKKDQGFTVVELIVVVTVMGLLIGILFGPLDDLYISNTTSAGQITQDSDTRSALYRIATDLTYSNGFIGSIPAPVIPAGAGSNNAGAGWSSTSSSSTDLHTLMASVYASDAEANSATRKPIAVNQNLVGSCSATYIESQISAQNIAKNTYVYFVRDNTLYRRTMINTPQLAPTIGLNGLCSQPYQKQSCASGCDASDAVIVKNVTEFKIQYYSDTTMPLSTVNDTTVATAKAAKISIKTQPARTSSRISPTTAEIKISISQ